MSTEETTIALLDIKAKIAACGDGFIIRNTLRHQAMEIAAALVDPTYAASQSARPAPVVRSGVAMSHDTDPACGF